MENALTTDIFTPYVDALNNYNACCDRYRATERAANDVLHKIERRQAAERSQIAVKLADLESEEKRLKAIVRQHILRGENPFSADLETGAKLAIISEQKDALQVLTGKRCMTDEEKTEWETAVSDLDDAAADLNKAISQRKQATAKLEAYVRSLEYWGAHIPNMNNSSLFDKAYSLNSDGGADDEEEN